MRSTSCPTSVRLMLHGRLTPRSHAWRLSRLAARRLVHDPESGKYQLCNPLRMNVILCYVVPA